MAMRPFPLLVALGLFGAGFACAAADAGALKPWPGGATPPLALKDLRGRSHTLDDYRGRVVVLNFWASWCEPCRDEMPAMQHLKDRLAGRPFALIAVNMGEGAGRVQRFLDMMPIDYTVLLDPDMSVSKRWQVRLLPYSFVLDRGHRIRYYAVGEVDWNDPAVASSIDALINEP
ncbi:MAG: TlpA family protein disulfide reductase [Burkholderiales bacterium]|nr:TlpA family protein disulfide reductase [Burkholderiales bacterium]